MRENLLSDVRLYGWLVVMQVRAQWQYKFNLSLDIATYLAVTALETIGILLYFIPFPTLLGWQMGEVLLLASVTSISFGLTELIGAGIDGFPAMIRQGTFDQVLLRPVGVLTQVAGSDFRLRRLGRITQGSACFVIALWLVPGLHWSPDKIVVLLLGLFSGMLVFLAIMLLGATLCFWTVESTELMNTLTYGGREMLSYPITIYHELLQRIFLFVIPIALMLYAPVCYILGRALPFGLPGQIVFISPVVAFLFALIAGQIWRLGTRHYQSTGS
jgi:ABC-2 type transport system permease protein